MFIVAFPLATVLSFVNNYLEMRIEAWKLCQLCRRPEPRASEDIGTWATILEFMGVAAVLINAGLVAFTGSFGENYTWAERIWVFIAFSFSVLFIKFVVSVLVPDVARDTEIQLERQDFIVSKVIRSIGDEGDDEAAKKNFKPNLEYSIRITDDDPL